MTPRVVEREVLRELEPEQMPERIAHANRREPVHLAEMKRHKRQEHGRGWRNRRPR